MAQMRNQYDQIHLFDCWLDFNFCAIRAGKILGKKVIVETCLMGADDPDTIVEKGQKNKYSIDNLRMQDYLSADYFVSKSAYLDEIFSKHFPKNRYQTIPYFVDTTKFYPANRDDINGLRIKYEIPVHKTVVLFVGAINTRKGAKELVEAFLQFKSTHKNYYLLLVSPMNKERSDLEISVLNSLEQLDSKDYRVYTSVIDFVPDLMRLTDIYCLPSFQEGFPISICEAMCCEKFIIASDIKEIKDQQIKHQITGYLCQAGNVDSIINGFNFYKNNKIEAEEISKEAFNYGSTNFSLEVISKVYSQTYLLP